MVHESIKVDFSDRAMPSEVLNVELRIEEREYFLSVGNIIVLIIAFFEPIWNLDFNKEKSEKDADENYENKTDREADVRDMRNLG